MKVLLVSPLGYPINETKRYSGIEQLVWNYASELCKAHEVSVMGHGDSVFPNSVDVLAYVPSVGEDIYLQAELKSYQIHQSRIHEFDIIHDFSHSHLISRFNKNMPSLNLFWHAPLIAKFPKAPYNIIGLSHWACREFLRVYGQRAKYQQSIALDTSFYKLSKRHRGDRFLSLGALTPRKGHMGAIELCKASGNKLDIVGKGYDDEYEASIRKACVTTQFRFLGEVTDEVKVKLMQDCKALLFVNQEPEVTSHKVQESMMCGAPVITASIGALSEIVTHGRNGWLCDTIPDYLKAMEQVDKLPMDLPINDIYSIENVVRAYIPLYEKVAGGLRW